VPILKGGGKGHGPSSAGGREKRSNSKPERSSEGSGGNATISFVQKKREKRVHMRGRECPKPEGGGGEKKKKRGRPCPPKTPARAHLLMEERKMVGPKRGGPFRSRRRQTPFGGGEKGQWPGRGDR